MRSRGRIPFALALVSAVFVSAVRAGVATAGSGAVHIDALRDAALSWRLPVAVPQIRGVRLLVDAPRGSGPVLSVVRSIVRANHRIAPLDALALATAAHVAATREGVDPFFIAATLLQESAFDPNAISPAGAFGIAQFTAPTARFYDVDPFDPPAAIATATRVLAAYLARYAHGVGDPYAAAMAAYNAGPGTVSYYGGVPPYPETREYIADIHERWARLLAER